MTKYKNIAIITFIAFLASVITPFLALYNVTPSVKESASWIFGDKVLVCTNDGFQLVSLEDIKSGKYKHDNDNNHYKCPICYIAAHGTKDFILAEGIDYHPDAQKILLFASENRLTSLPLGVDLKSRAPPADLIA